MANCRICEKEILPEYDALKYGPGICTNCYVICPSHIPRSQREKYDIHRSKKLEKLVRERDGNI